MNLKNDNINFNEKVNEDRLDRWYELLSRLKVAYKMLWWINICLIIIIFIPIGIILRYYYINNYMKKVIVSAYSLNEEDKNRLFFIESIMRYTFKPTQYSQLIACAKISIGYLEDLVK